MPTRRLDDRSRGAGDKTADGGFRPAYNLQFASLPETGIVVAVSCGNVGSDRALAEPMAQAIETAYGRRADIIWSMAATWRARTSKRPSEPARGLLPRDHVQMGRGALRAASRRHAGHGPWRVRMDSQEAASSTNGARVANSFTPVPQPRPRSPVGARPEEGRSLRLLVRARRQHPRRSQAARRRRDDLIDRQTGPRAAGQPRPRLRANPPKCNFQLPNRPL